jgi:hypothetical protein
MQRLSITANEHSAKQETWIFRFWRILAALETLEKRVALLEQAVFGSHDHETTGTKKRSG